MRLNLVESVRFLAGLEDTDSGDDPPRDEMLMDVAVHWIVDDMPASEYPDAIIGDVLLDQDELDALLALEHWLLVVLREAGKMASAPQLRAAPSWPNVQAAATAAAKRLEGVD